MKNLKARYFDQLRQEMIYSDEDYMSPCNFWNSYCLKLEGESPPVIQLAIDKTDLNDKEIYDGDILLIGVTKFQVYYDETWSAYCVKDLTTGLESTMPATGLRMQVIGNVHQHPEILEQIQKT